MNRQFFLKISAAKARIDDTETALEAAIAATEAAPRADKVTVSAAVHEALQRLHAARAILVDLEISDPVDEQP